MNRGKTVTNNLSQDLVQEQWFVVDANNQKIGRLSTVISELLLGKYDAVKVAATHLNPMIKVVVVNASKLYVAMKKREQKEYTRYSGYPDGLKVTKLGEQMEKDPRRVIEHAVRGMLPKTRRGDAIYGNLYVYADANHKHEANKPVEFKV